MYTSGTLGRGKSLLLWEGHQDRVVSVAFSPDGKTAITRGSDQTVRARDRYERKELSRIEIPQKKLKAFGISSDGKILATGGEDGVIRLWDTRTGHEQRIIQRILRPSWRLPFHPTEGTLFPRRRRAITQARLWEVSTGKELWARPKSSGWMHRVAFSANGDVLAFAGYGFCFRKSATGTPLLEVDGSKVLPERNHFNQEQKLFQTLAYAPNGRMIAAGYDNNVRLWETATGGERLTLVTQVGEVLAVAFSPNGKILASAAKEGTIQLWDTVNGIELGRVVGHRGSVLSLAFSADGTTMASASSDTTVLFWDVKRCCDAHLPRDDRQWQALIDPDAGKSNRAMAQLASTPAETVRLLRQRLQPAPGKFPDAAGIAKRIADLDSPRFAVRSKATKELEVLGEGAEPALRNLVHSSVSLEVRIRAEEILRKVELRRGQTLTPETLRIVRADRSLGATRHAGRAFVAAGAGQGPSSRLADPGS